MLQFVVGVQEERIITMMGGNANRSIAISIIIITISIIIFRRSSTIQIVRSNSGSAARSNSGDRIDTSSVSSLL